MPLAFVDDDSKKQGELIEGVGVLTMATACERYADQATFVVASWHPQHCHLESANRLKKFGGNEVIP